MNCWMLPTGIEGFRGVIRIETRGATVTVSPVDPLIEPNVAWIVEVPCATLVAKPNALIVATLGAEELQAAEEVTSCVPPLMVAVATYCCLLPSGIEGFTGVTVIAVTPP